MQLQETLTLLASIDPWIQNKLKNKVLCEYEVLKTNEEEGPMRFRKEPENPEELTIQDFRLAQLNPLFIAKSRATPDQKKKLSAQKGSAFPPFSLNQNTGHQPQGPGHQRSGSSSGSLLKPPNRSVLQTKSPLSSRGCSLGSLEKTIYTYLA